MKCSSDCNKDAVEGKKRCQYHLDRAKENRRKHRLILWKNGICQTCKTNKSVINKKQCQDCLNNDNNRNAEKTLRGLCHSTFCKKQTFSGKWFCEECHAQNKLRVKNRRETRREAKLCEVCGGQAIEGRTGKSMYCEVCYLKRVSISRLNNMSKWAMLLEVYKANPICPYTGIQLTLGVNASLHHIIPIGRGGGDDKENLCFVYDNGAFDINRMIGEMLPEEFKLAIKSICKNLT